MECSVKSVWFCWSPHAYDNLKAEFVLMLGCGMTAHPRSIRFQDWLGNPHQKKLSADVLCGMKGRNKRVVFRGENSVRPWKLRIIWFSWTRFSRDFMSVVWMIPSSGIFIYQEWAWRLVYSKEERQGMTTCAPRVFIGLPYDRFWLLDFSFALGGDKRSTA